MTSTLNRTLTDSMEDESMYLSLEQHSNLHQTISNVSNGSNSDQPFFNIPGSQQPQMTSNTNHISHDFSEYLHLNGSQDSLKPLKEDIRHYPLSNSSATHPFNSYANPNIFTNSQFPSDFYQNIDYTFAHDRSQSNNSSINNMQQQQQQQHQQAQQHQQVSLPIQNIPDTRSMTNNSYNVGYNNNIQQFVDSINLIEDNNDISVVPQDMYFNMMGDCADYSDMFLLNNGEKNQKSKQLNIFQPLVSSVHYSDDEDDDEDDFDMDNSNRNISDADMEMDLYGLSDDDSIFALDPTANDDDYFLDNNNNINNNFSKDTISNAFKNIQITNNVSKDNLELEDLGNQSDASEDIYTPALLGQTENQTQNEDEAEISSLHNSVATREQIHQDALLGGQSFTLNDAINEDKPQTEEIDSAINAMNSENDENAEHICKIINPKTGLPCLKKFSRPYDLTRHEKSIHATKRLFYRCMFCEDDERRKVGLESNHPIVFSCDYRNSKTSLENSMSSRHTNKKTTNHTSVDQYLSNKTFSRGDALTRHLKSKHELNTDQVASAVDYAKEHVEFKKQDS
ncbi:unnamed protein product [[Candida] boidinii]|uniref:Unnamed protein product n=1 Tax=Candida boidinii TaxID=5477 RepID=A0A9W6WL96_CANBO|nr:hypothetical protein B5S33_g4313 [[Candida] boidinii]GME85479.1 unnamed protein product [[Candida] boidinii]